MAALAILVFGVTAASASAQSADTVPGTPPAESSPDQAAPPPPSAPSPAPPPSASSPSGGDNHAVAPPQAAPPAPSSPPTPSPVTSSTVEPPDDGASWLPIALLAGVPLAFGAAAILFIRALPTRRGLARD